MGYTDQQLRNAVDAVFGQFDKDKSGTLDRSEVHALINAALNQMGANRQATQQQVKNTIQSVDKNQDGKLTKIQLFEVFKKVANN